VYHARNPEAECEEHVDEKGAAAAVHKEDGHWGTDEGTDQTHQAGGVAILAASLSFTHG